DGDDWWARGKLSTVIAQLVNNPDVGAVGHGFYEVYSGPNPHRIVVPERVYEFHLRDVAAARLFSLLACFLGTSKVTIRKAILERILPIPEELVIEADEYIFTLAPAIAPARVLNEPLFYYRFHDNNLFMIQSEDAVKRLRKCKVLTELLRTLPPRLAQLGVSSEVVKIVLEHLWVDSERMKLIMDGGKPWQTFAVERAAFLLGYDNVGLGYWLFKSFVL